MFLQEHIRARPITGGTFNPRLTTSFGDITANDLLSNKRVPLPRYMTQIKDKLVDPKRKLLFKKYSYSELLSLCNSSKQLCSKLPPLALDSKAVRMHAKDKRLPCLSKSHSRDLLQRAPGRALALVPKPPIKLIARTAAIKLAAVAQDDSDIAEWSARSRHV